MLRARVASPILAAALLSPLALGFPGAVAQEASPVGSPPAFRSVDVELRNVEGDDAGLSTFAETVAGEVSIGVAVEGLAPGEHGIHVHETGICDPAGDQPFASAGGHYNPTGVDHGAPSGAVGSVPMGTPEGAATPGVTQGHAGDLGNILVDDSRLGRLQLTTDQFSLAELDDADGSALVIHADRDDLVTDPGGGSGERVVCGVIFPPEDGATPSAATPTS